MGERAAKPRSLTRFRHEERWSRGLPNPPAVCFARPEQGQDVMRGYMSVYSGWPGGPQGGISAVLAALEDPGRYRLVLEVRSV
jgi:hypothetical protein